MVDIPIAAPGTSMSNGRDFNAHGVPSKIEGRDSIAGRQREPKWVSLGSPIGGVQTGMPQPDLQTIVRPALETLRGRYVRYLHANAREAERVATSIARNPFRAAGLRENDLAQSRLITVRAQLIGSCLERCALLLASRHENCTIDLAGPASIAFVIERPRDRIVVCCQSRQTTENGGTQLLASQAQLLAQRDASKTTHLLRGYLAEPGIDSEHALRGDVHHVHGPLVFFWLSGSRQCWADLRDEINRILATREIRQAELLFRSSIEGALIGLEGREITEAQFGRSRYDLERALGPCRPVLMETPAAEPPDDIFDMLAEIDDEDDQ